MIHKYDETVLYIFLFTLMALFLYSCATSPKVEKSITSRNPRIILQVACLDLTNLSKRIEQKHIIELVKTLKREQVEVFAVQGISRYPGVATRLDFVNELSAQTDWRNAYGEMLNISGRQTGNAVFSSYPIISYQNITFEKIIPKSFESALQTIIDVGVYPLAIISTQLPTKMTTEEQSQCIKLISKLSPDTTNPLTIIAGNLPSSETIRKAFLFTDIFSPKPAKTMMPKMWCSTNVSFQLLSSRTVETEMGTIGIAQFALY